MASGGDYEALYEQIKSYGYWAHITESTFAVKSSKNATEIRDHLGEYLPKGSKLMVVQSAHVAAWRNTICSNEWLKKNL
ncbi:MAG: hypothetical protein PHE08_08095 [Bacteroidales bacterium]|nr:hypothetical protein [Bacteroidales bacterium]